MSEELIWPIICTVAGLSILVFGVRIWRLLQASKSWPKITGKIIESGVQSGWSGSGGEYNYIVRPKVIYEYDVGGVRYTASRLALIELNSANTDSALSKAQKYLVGQVVEVYYDSSKPSSATLKVGDPTSGKLPFGIIILGILVAIAGIFWFSIVRK